MWGRFKRHHRRNRAKTILFLYGYDTNGRSSERKTSSLPWMLSRVITDEPEGKRTVVKSRQNQLPVISSCLHLPCLVCIRSKYRVNECKRRIRHLKYNLPYWTIVFEYNPQVCFLVSFWEQFYYQTWSPTLYINDLRRYCAFRRRLPSMYLLWLSSATPLPV